MTGATIHLKIKDIHPMVVQTANRNTPSESKLQNIKPQCEDLLWHTVSCYWYCYCQGLRLTLNHCSWMWCLLWPDNSKITEERRIIDRRSLPIINKIQWQCKCHGIKGILGKGYLTERYIYTQPVIWWKHLHPKDNSPPSTDAPHQPLFLYSILQCQLNLMKRANEPKFCNFHLSKKFSRKWHLKFAHNHLLK